MPTRRRQLKPADAKKETPADVLAANENQARPDEALRESEQRLRAMIEAAPFGAHQYELHPDGRLVFVGYNQAANRILQVDNAQFVGKTIEEAFPPLVETRIPDLYRAVATGGARLEEEQVSYSHGKITGVYEISAFQSGANRMAVFFRDVTERRKAEEALRKSEDKFSKVFMASPVAIVIARLRDGLLYDLNRAAERVYGYSREEAIGRTTLELGLWVDPRDREALVQGLSRVEAVHDREFRWRAKDGKVVIANYAAELIDLDGEKCILAMFTDVTARRQAEERLQRMQLQLAHVARLSTMGEMVAEMVHELNQPLYAILNYARACQNLLAADAAPDRETLLAWSDKIAQIAADAGAISKRFLAFARRTESTKAHCAVNEVVEESLALVASEVRHASVCVETLLAPQNPAIYADRVQIQQVLVNLLRNAIEAVDKSDVQHRCVTIQTTVTDMAVEITVTDNGVGFPADGQLNVFEPFVTTKSYGLGMGLAVSLAIVEAHQGKIWAAANPNGGAIFHCELPLA